MNDDNYNNRLREDFEKSLVHYRTLMSFMGSDLPIGCLCLPTAIENLLDKQGYTRLYDLIGHDLSKIKGLGSKRSAILATRLNEFFSVSI